jgi:hypothetical protein
VDPSTRSRRRDRSEDLAAALLEAGDEPEVPQPPAPSRKLSKMLDTLSVRALFFASFAYYGVDFFYEPTSAYAGEHWWWGLVVVVVFRFECCLSGPPSAQCVFSALFGAGGW